MSSFSRPCPRSASPPPMSSGSTCTVAVSRRCWLMRIGSRTAIGGVPTRPVGRKPGKSSPNGAGTCARNSATSGTPPRCASPNLPPPHASSAALPDRSSAGPAFGPPQWARPARVGSLGGHDFLLQPDGTLRCRHGATLYPQERRPEHAGTVRVLYAARIADCRSCPLRLPCQGHGPSTKKPRRVSAVLHPLPQPAPAPPAPASLSAPHPILWGDWSRCQPRRAWMRWLVPPPGHSGSLARFPTCRHACTALTRVARPLALDMATTACPQCAATHGPAGRDHRLWAFRSVCPDPGGAKHLN
jgi:hypothetical protein